MTGFSPLTQALVDHRGYPVVGEADFDDAVRDRDFSVVFFPGDFERLGESNDVAVILPELVAAFDGVFAPFVAARAAERKLQARFRFGAFPALLFLRRGEYLGALTRVLDWSDYLAEIAEILEREPSQPPPFRLPEGMARPRTGEDDAIHIH